MFCLGFLLGIFAWDFLVFIFFLFFSFFLGGFVFVKAYSRWLVFGFFLGLF